MIYEVCQMVSFSSIKDVLDENKFRNIIMEIIEVFHEIKYNSVLSIRNVIFKYNDIYIDRKTGNLSLLAIPVKISSSIDELILYERNVIYIMSMIIYKSKFINSFLCRKIYDDCQSGVIFLDELYNNMLIGKYGNEYIGLKQDESIKENYAILKNIDGKADDIQIFSKHIVIGKSNDADIIIDIKGISRKHCEIIVKDNGMFINDLASTNGTKVNNVKIIPGQLIPVVDDTNITIADVSYIANVIKKD